MLEARTPDAGIGAPPDAGRGGSRYRDQRIAQSWKRGLPMPETAHRLMPEARTPDAGYGAPPDVGRVAARNLREPRLPSGALLRAPSDDGGGMAVRQT